MRRAYSVFPAMPAFPAPGWLAGSGAFRWAPAVPAGTQLISVRHFADERPGPYGGVGGLWKYLTGQGKESLKRRDGVQGEAAAAAAAGDDAAASSAGGVIVPNSHESRYREVFAVPLPRRPLFPGGIMPVTVHNNKLIKELVEIRRQGAQAYVGAFLRLSPPLERSAAEALSLTEDILEDGGGGGGGDPLTADSLHGVGTFAQVHTIVPHEHGAQLLLLGHRRLRRTGVAGDDPLRLSVLHLKDAPYDPHDDTLKATTMEVISTLKELLHLHPLYNEQMRNFIQFGADFTDLSRLADLAASLTSSDAGPLQAALEELAVPERAAAALLLLKKEAELVKLQQDIGRRVEEKVSKDQRRYFLMEQLRSIKKELGLEKDEKTALAQRFRERLEPVRGALPEGAARVIEEELEKLAAIEPASSEFNVTRNYLDWLTALPWGRASEELLDVAAARRVLDEDHFGMEDVKDRILEFIAVGRLRGSTQGKILCLVGPPGVGKTSVGRSIARALGRAYYRFSVGGLSDVAELKGHRRTYVGAMPGKAVQCLKATGVCNPLVLIDEVDKLGRGWQGDPASALLELLDPEQNAAFTDHYLDVPVDLSRVLFVATANALDAVPAPLLDRMEVIQVSGYTAAEKVAIARVYLEPAARADAGVPPGAVAVSDAALGVLVAEYAREAGVRNLKKLLEKVYRKAAMKLVQAGVEGTGAAEARAKAAAAEAAAAEAAAEVAADAAAPGGAAGSAERELGAGAALPAAATPPASQLPAEEPPAFAAPLVTVDVGDLKEFVGQPPYPSDRIYRHHTPPGVVTGLAWTPLGGATLYVEAADVEKGEGKGSLRTTGQLGDVMKESAAIAHTFARRFLHSLRPDSAFFADHALHVHVPAGATPKDGPSAGATITTALLSLALGRRVRADLAMTGEVTLTGKVLPVGGIKEKALAARRSGVTKVLFPEGNRRDWEELGEDVRAGLEAAFVEEYAQVFELAFEEERDEL